MQSFFATDEAVGSLFQLDHKIIDAPLISNETTTPTELDIANGMKIRLSSC